MPTDINAAATIPYGHCSYGNTTREQSRLQEILKGSRERFETLLNQSNRAANKKRFPDGQD